MNAIPVFLIMKPLLQKSSWAALAVALFGLPSCVVSGGFEAAGPPPGAAYYVYGGVRYYYPPAYPGYLHRTSVYRYYYGGRYYSYPWWKDARYRHYLHHHHHDHWGDRHYARKRSPRPLFPTPPHRHRHHR